MKYLYSLTLIAFLFTLLPYEAVLNSKDNISYQPFSYQSYVSVGVPS